MAVNTPAGGAKIYDRNGTLLYQYVDDREGLRAPVPLDQISPSLVAATIATEDASFYSNQGVNTTGLVRAHVAELQPASGHFLDGSGGSSITQQLIKNVYFPPSKQYARSADRKLTEIVFSLKLTDDYSKDQILTWYLNQISYGGLYNGVEAASPGYFGKPAKDLTLAEAALLAGHTRVAQRLQPVRAPGSGAGAAQPRARPAVVAREAASRRKGLLHAGPRARSRRRRRRRWAWSAVAFTIEAPHFVLSYVAAGARSALRPRRLYHGGLSVTTSLDLPLQKKANELLEQYVTQFEAQSNSHNGAVR